MSTGNINFPVGRRAPGLTLWLLISALVPQPVSATSLIRLGLDELVATNSVVLIGEVREVRPYWNEDRTFILSDVSMTVSEILKGPMQDNSLTLTIMGGSVDELTTLIVGGAKLIPGHSYLLFLDEEDLPGVRGTITVGDHCQGVFDIELVENRLRAVSQAIEHNLIPDSFGNTHPPGEAEGLLLSEVTQAIRALVQEP